MLPRSHRLPLSANHSFSGQRCHHPNLTLIYAPNQLKHFRAAFIITKKISPQAVVRNQLKRRLSSTLQHLVVSHAPFDLLLIPRPSLISCSEQQLTSLLHQLLQQAQIPTTIK